MIGRKTAIRNGILRWPTQCADHALRHRVPATQRHGGQPPAAPADVEKILQDVHRRAVNPKPASSSLDEENKALRREVAELRQQLMAATTAPAPSGIDDSNPLQVEWQAAQLEQTRRQVDMLTRALVQRKEIAAELESVLVRLRQPLADGTWMEGAPWAASALRRLRLVQFGEELA